MLINVSKVSYFDPWDLLTNAANLIGLRDILFFILLFGLMRHCSLSKNFWRTKGKNQYVRPMKDGICAAVALFFVFSCGDDKAPQQLSGQFADAGCPSGDCEPEGYRIAQLELRDPHAFVKFGLFCLDVTDMVNSQISARFNADEIGDGYLDAAVAMVFRPLNLVGPSAVNLHVAQCTAPVESTTCSSGEAQYDTYAMSQESGTCMEPVAGTTSGFEPSIDIPTGGCFATDPVDMTITVADLDLDLKAARLAASFSGQGSDLLTNGLMAGFLPETAADNILLPDDLPIIGGKAFSSVLPGGAGSCGDDTRDIGPDGSLGLSLIHI